MKKMINSKRYCDVIFSVEDKFVYGHKVILCSRSDCSFRTSELVTDKVEDRNEFFKAMLLGPWAKQNVSEEDPVLIPDTGYSIFMSVGCEQHLIWPKPLLILSSTFRSSSSAILVTVLS